jgi:hypothetical protein
LELVQVGIRRWIAERTAHGYDLAFVVEGVRKDVVENEGGSANSVIAVWEVELHLRVQLFIVRGGEVGSGATADFLLKNGGVSNTGEVAGIAIDVSETLKGADPEAFAVEDMDDLLLDGVESEAGDFPGASLGRKCGEVIEKQRETGVRPGVEFADAIERKHGSAPHIIVISRGPALVTEARSVIGG